MVTVGFNEESDQEEHQNQVRTPVSTIDRNPVMYLTTEEAGYLNQLSILESEFRLHFPPEMGMAIANCIKKGKRFPNHMLFDIIQEFIDKTTQFITFTDFFSELSIQDQSNLSLNIAKFTPIIKLGMLGSAKQMSLADKSIVILRDRFQNEEILSEVPNLALHQIMPGSQWYSSQEEQENSLECVSNVKNLNMDPVMYLLVTFITLYQSYGINLDNHQKVWEIQSYFKRLLFRYLQSQMGHVHASVKYDKVLKVSHQLNFLAGFITPSEE